MSARHLWPLACALLLVTTSEAVGERVRPVAVSKGPYLTNLLESGVEIRCELNRASPLAVEVSRDSDAAAPLLFESRTATSMHVVHAEGLIPATRYAYAVRASGTIIGGGRFSTAPAAESRAPLKFLVYGDDRSDPNAHAAVARALVAASSDFLVNTGDLVEDGGSPEDWQTFFDIEARLLRDRALYVAIGNHELYDDVAGANFARYFGFANPAGLPRPYGTVRLSNVRFFFLNAMHDWGTGEDRTWLEQELARADGERGLVWRIAVMHQAPWSSGPHGASAVLVKAHVPELLSAHHVDLLFAGHDHIYERGEGPGLKYVISGGGGAPLYRASKIATTRKSESTYHFVEVTTDTDALHVLARRLDGSILDECGFKKDAEWSCDPPARKDGGQPSSPVAPSSRCACSAVGRNAFSAPVGALGWAAVALLQARRRARNHPARLP